MLAMDWLLCMLLWMVAMDWLLWAGSYGRVAMEGCYCRLLWTGCNGLVATDWLLRRIAMVWTAMDWLTWTGSYGRVAMNWLL